MSFNAFTRRYLPRGYAETIKYMYSPQGVTQQSVLEEYAWAFKYLSSDKFVIAFGKSVLPWCRDAEEMDSELPRVNLIKTVLQQSPESSRFRFHIFGGRWTPSQSLYHLTEADERFISIDSVKPCVCAAAGVLYPQPPVMHGLDPRYRLSLDTPVAVDEQSLAENVAAFKTAYGATNE